MIISTAIMITTFCRPEKLESLLISLKENVEIDEFPIYIYIDHNPEMINIYKKLNEKYNHSSINFIYREFRLGSIPNAKSGLKELFELYEQVIALEDDLLVSKSYLNFMNLAFNLAREDKRVFAITGYNFPCEKNYISNYLKSEMFINWGVGFLKSRFFYPELYKINSSNLFNYNFLIQNFKYGWHLFCLTLEMILFKKEWWDVKFNYYMAVNYKYIICPSKSLVINSGFDGSGENCAYDPVYINQHFSDSKIERLETLEIENISYRKFIKDFFFKKNATIFAYFIFAFISLFSKTIALVTLNFFKRINKISLL